MIKRWKCVEDLGVEMESKEIDEIWQIDIRSSGLGMIDG